MPEEAVYKKVDTGREGDRVYIMEIGGDRRFFYWMQDKSPTKDEVRCRRLSEDLCAFPTTSIGCSWSSACAFCPMRRWREMVRLLR